MTDLSWKLIEEREKTLEAQKRAQQAEIERDTLRDAVREALPERDMVVMRRALGAYISDYECVDPDADIERARALDERLSTLRVLLGGAS